MRKALYILADLDDGDVRWLADHGERQEVQPGETIITEGHPIDTLYIVIDGDLAVSVGGGKPLARLSAGDIVGEMSLVEKRPPSASVAAIDGARVLAIAQDAIKERLATDDAFAARFYRALAVFLSDRLRSTVAGLGYTTTNEDDARFEIENELDEGLLDTLHVAGGRMRRLLSLLEGGSDARN